MPENSEVRLPDVAPAPVEVVLAERFRSQEEVRATITQDSIKTPTPADVASLINSLRELRSNNVDASVTPIAGSESVTEAREAEGADDAENAALAKVVADVLTMLGQEKLVDQVSGATNFR